MPREFDRGSRREFVADVGRIASAAALAACATPRAAEGLAARPAAAVAAPGDWDLSWVDRVASATNRAVFDWPAVADPTDPIVMEMAARYLDGCEAVYGARGREARAVLNVRTRAVASALTDSAWERWALGAEYEVSDPATKRPAVRNPFWRRPAGTAVTAETPATLEELVGRGAIVLVCDFALGHLAKRLATKAGRAADDVHRELRGAFVPGAYAVPSGIFGLARAQNAGCAYVRV